MENVFSNIYPVRRDTEGLPDEVERLRIKVNEQDAEIGRLKAALAKYGEHTYSSHVKRTGQCTCGYSAELG